MKRKYLIAGGSSGIGLELVKSLAEQGNEVIVVSRTNDALAGLENVRHIQHDFSESSELKLDVDELDGIAYCPGTINLKPFRSLKSNDFQHDFQVNVLGAISCIQSALPALKKSKSPSVVLFSSVAVNQGMKYHASIAASKGAIEGLTKSLAAELSPDCRVNCIAPSVVDTALANRILSSPERKEASAKRHPLNKVGEASDIASMAEFLLSEKSGWITGQIIGIDGGMSTLRML